jgi:hypothetical protein
MTSHSIILSGLTASSTYHYAVVSADSVGNTATSSDQTFTTANTADTTPPTVTITAPSGQLAEGTTQTTLSVTTNENATCAWATTAGQAFASMTTFNTTGGTSHSTTLTGLTDGSSYTFYVRCKDTFGNISGDMAVSFSVASGATYDRAAYLGINPNAVSYFSSELPFLNIFKATNIWGGTDTK